jgi:hypothetical protein
MPIVIEGHQSQLIFRGRANGLYPLMGQVSRFWDNKKERLIKLLLSWPFGENPIFLRGAGQVVCFISSKGNN